MDCLVTKLKAAATNDLLVPAGYVELFSLSGTNVELVASESNFKLYNNKGPCKLLGDGYFISNGTNVGKSFTFPANVNTPYAVHVNSGTVKVISKYGDMRTYATVNKASSDLKINLDNFALARVEGIPYSAFQITGAISGKVDNHCIWDATYPSYLNYGGTGIVGNIKDAVKKSSVKPYSFLILQNHPYLTGNIEDLFDIYASAGASGQCTFAFYYCPNLFYQGEALDWKNVKVNFSSGSWTEVTP